MKIFSWMQSKLNGRQVTKKPNTSVANNHMGQGTSKEEFSDWPQSLLAIGTFGMSSMKGDPESPCQSLPQTPMSEEEEVGELQKDLISFLDTEESETQEVPSEPVCEELPLSRDMRLQRSLSGMFSRGKDILVDQRNNVIRKKSLAFLLNKVFKSRNRFNLVKDSLPDPHFDKSRMEKVLRAILNKKIHPQTYTAKAMPNKYLVTKDVTMSDDESADDNDGSTWVKTDSEYIVLEI